MWDSIASRAYTNYPEDFAQPKCSLPVEKLKASFTGLVGAEEARVF